MFHGNASRRFRLGFQFRKRKGLNSMLPIHAELDFVITTMGYNE